jgi:SAM-dependent methyltransferase
MLTLLRRVAQKSKTMIIIYHIYDNWRTKKRFASGNYETCSGATHAGKSLSESLSYINQVFDDYLTYSGISPRMLKEKRVLEIGPGDNFGVALKFLIAGAKQVVCLDKFFSKRDTGQQFKIYREIRAHLNDGERDIYDSIISLDGGIAFNAEKLHYIHGVGIEEADKILEPGSFDFIVSRAVIEHLYDPNAAFSAMNRLLKSGSYMIHKIDFSDHGLFSSKGFHPLTYLTIPESLYRLMTYDSGKPNRRLINYYKQKMIALGYDVRILISHIIGSEAEILPHKETVIYGCDYFDSTILLIKNIRPHLTDKFRNMPDDELIADSIFLTAKKTPTG